MTYDLDHQLRNLDHAREALAFHATNLSRCPAGRRITRAMYIDEVAHARRNLLFEIGNVRAIIDPAQAKLRAAEADLNPTKRD